MKARLLVLTIVLLLYFVTVRAEEACNPKNYQELVLCAEAKSSDISLSNQRLKAAGELSKAARQWINPELEAESVSKGSEKSETTASLLFNIRLGGKRTALIDEAEGEIQKAGATRDLGVGGARLNLILSLYRLSHLKSEIAIEEESVETFGTITKQFQSRKMLSPEQEVSMTVFRMANSDHMLKLSKLKLERNKLLKDFSAVTGISQEVVLRNLPARKQNWQQISSANEISNAPQIREAMGELKVSQSLRLGAEAQAWPDLKIGPAVKTVKDNNLSDTFVGFGLSVPLPVFTLNGGQKSFAAQKVVESEINLNQVKKKTAALREQLVAQYNETLAVLKTSMSGRDIHEKHEKVERLFFRGIVPSSLVIEAHRQLIELETQKNESELSAIEALGQILIIDNNFSEVQL